MSLARATAWLISDGKIGMDVQCHGVATALGVRSEMKHISPSGIWAVVSPWFGPAPRERIGRKDCIFSPPWPDIAIATGRQSIPYLRAVRKAAGRQTFTVILQDSKIGAGGADLIWVPEHDTLRADNVITTLTAPHSFTQERIAELRGSIPAAIAALPSPRIMLSLGGPNGVYNYSKGTIERLVHIVEQLAAQGVSFLLTPSRRTPKALTAAIEVATRSSARIFWDGSGENPYGDFLCHSDIIIVTADSVNMTGEACATGKPVYVFEPDGGSKKFSLFHQSLRRYGATRELPVRFGHLESWTYEPLDSASTIAAEIESRWRVAMERCRSHS